MRLIILPQALKIVIPGIVNSFISLFKDTSLVLIIGIFDLLGIVQQNFTDPNWASPVTPATGYVFAAFVFWMFCFSMSRYSHVHGAPAEHRPQALGASRMTRRTPSPRRSLPHVDAHAGSFAIRRGRDDRRQQVVRRFPRPARHQPQGHARRADRDLRAVRLGQVDDDPLHQPARGAPEAARSSSTASSSPTTSSRSTRSAARSAWCSSTSTSSRT